MALLSDKLAETKTAAVLEADARARGTLTDADGNPVLAPPVAVVVDYLDQLKQALDALLGDGLRRPGDPEAVPANLTGFFHWVVDVLYLGQQQLLLAQVQQAAAMQVLSDTMGTSFAALAPRVERAQADATAALLADQATALALAANDRRDEAQAADIVAVKAQLVADALRLQASEAATQLLQSQQAAQGNRLALVEQQAAATKTQADVTAASLALTQAQQLKDEQGLAAAQQQLTAAQALATSTAASLATLQARVADDEKALAASQQAAAAADAKAVAAQQAASSAQAQATAASTAAAGAQTTADAAKASAATAQAAATAVGLRFREVLGVAVPAIAIGQVGQVTVSWSPAFADTAYVVTMQPETSGLLGLVADTLSKTPSSCVLQLKSSLGLAVAVGGTIGVNIAHT